MARAAIRAALAALLLVSPGCALFGNGLALGGPQADAGGGDAWDGVLGVTGAIAEWSGIPGAAVAVGAIAAARKARRQAQEAVEAQDGPSRAQAQLDAVQARVARLEGFHPEASA